jgi:hypothetical protein
MSYLPIERLTVYSRRMDDVPTRYDNFLYLLAELEQAIERNTIQWDAKSSISAQRRLDRLTAKLRRIATKSTGHSALRSASRPQAPSHR